MDAVTYPDTKVIEFMNNNVVALRVPSNSQPLAGRFNVKWTPVLAVLDQDGQKIEIDKETGEVVMRFKLPVI